MDHHEPFNINIDTGVFSVYPFIQGDELQFRVLHKGVDPMIFRMDFDHGTLVPVDNSGFWQLVGEEIATSIESKFT